MNIFALVLVISVQGSVETESAFVIDPSQLISRLADADAVNEALFRNFAVQVESVIIRTQNDVRTEESKTTTCSRREDKILAIVERSGGKNSNQIVSCLNPERSYYFRLKKLPNESIYEVENFVSPENSVPSARTAFDSARYFRSQLFYRTSAGELLSDLVKSSEIKSISEMDGVHRPLEIVGSFPTGNYERFRLVVFQDLNLAISLLRFDFKGDNDEEYIATKIDYSDESGGNPVPLRAEIHQRTVVKFDGKPKLYEQIENLKFGDFQFEPPSPQIFEIEHYGVRNLAVNRNGASFIWNSPFSLVILGLVACVGCCFYFRMKFSSGS